MGEYVKGLVKVHLLLILLLCNRTICFIVEGILVVKRVLFPLGKQLLSPVG